MKPVLLVFLTLSLVAYASLINHDHGLVLRRDHSQLAQLSRRANASKRCKPKPAAAPSPSPSPSPAPHKQPAPAPPPPSSNNNGILTVHSNICGPSGATKEPSATSGPNGSEDWLNCGITGGGWTPPLIRIDQVIAMDLDQAIGTPGSPFQKCSPFIGLFKQYAWQHGIPPIMIASFALQESSCNPDTVGGAGEQGLMQLTKDKCGDAPGGNCKDPDFNIRTGAKFFADTLASNGGNVLLSIGQYNGWTPGLTYGAGTAAGYGSCCRCQNNMDYLQQFMNGWLQNKNVYGGWPRIGKYFNLDICI
ncbi:lysozyme-like protein [Phlegmacium glaucopus]|nr:lysozyme-like protein [Phlegmacium glaucopus]